jgi:DNA replication regulator SLD3
MWKQRTTREGEKSFGRTPFLQQESTLPSTTAESHKYDEKKRLAIEALQSMVKRPSTPLPTDLPHTETASQAPPDSILPLVPELADSPMVAETPAQPTGAEIFENVRTQYLEALYLSKVQLFRAPINTKANSQ